MRKIIFSALVGVMLLGAASVAVAQTDGGDESTIGRVGGFIQDVIDGLVTDGALTPDQADAVVGAIDEARADLHAERQALRAERQAVHEAVQAALEDGVITADELAELPDFPWNDTDGPLADALADGEITQEELQGALGGFGHRGFGHRGFGPGGFGHGGFGPGADTGDVTEPGA